MIRKRSLLMLAILTVVIVIAAWGYHHRRHSFKQAETHPMWQAIEKAGTISLQAHDPTTNLAFKNLKLVTLR